MWSIHTVHLIEAYQRMSYDKQSMEKQNLPLLLHAVIMYVHLAVTCRRETIINRCGGDISDHFRGHFWHSAELKRTVLLAVICFFFFNAQCNQCAAPVIPWIHHKVTWARVFASIYAMQCLRLVCDRSVETTAFMFTQMARWHIFMLYEQLASASLSLFFSILFSINSEKITSLQHSLILTHGFDSRLWLSLYF